MSRPMKTRRIGFLASLAVLIIGVIGCSVDTPTAPDQVPAPLPTPGENNWNITVSVDPDVLEAGLEGGVGSESGVVIIPAIVSIDVKSRDDGSSPPNGTTMIVSTTLGELGSVGSGVTSIGVVIDRGKASAYLFPGNIVAYGEVTARLEGSVGRDRFEVVGTADSFIVSISPNSGSESGGTHVTIKGTGFSEPLRVKFGDYYGTVTSVTETEIRVVTPRASDDLDNEPCGVGGTEYFATAVDVTVEFGDGGEDAELQDGYFYTPDNTGCIGG